MNEKTTQLASRLDYLLKRYHETTGTQCHLAQAHIKAEYLQVKAALQGLEKLTTTNERAMHTPLAALNQAAALVGMYLMV